MGEELDKKILEQIDVLNQSAKKQIDHLTSEIEDIKRNLQGERNERIITQGNGEIVQIQSEISKVKNERLKNVNQLNEDRRIFSMIIERREILSSSIRESRDAISSLENDEKQYLEELQRLTYNKSFQPKSKEQMQLEQDLEKIRQELTIQRSRLSSRELTLKNIEMQYNNMLNKYNINKEQGQSQSQQEQQKPEQQGQSQSQQGQQKPEQQGQSQSQQGQQKPEQQEQSQSQQGLQVPNNQGETIVSPKSASRFDNIKNGVNAITAKVPVGKRMKENKDNKLKVKIGGVISTELDGENKTVGMSYYAENKDDDTRIYKLFKKLGFDDKAIDSTWKEINLARGDINVVKALLESSKDGMQAVKYLDDYLDVIKGNKKKLETFTLEYNLRDRSKFGKDEWKNFKDMALDSRDFAKVKGKTMYLLAMTIANFKPIKVISWPFKKAVKAIQGRKVEKITDGSGNSMREKLEGKLELGKVKVNEEAARQVAEEKAKDPQSKEKRER